MGSNSRRDIVSEVVLAMEDALKHSLISKL